MTTIKIKASHPTQGEFVVIEKKDFDPEKHELLDGERLGSTSGDTGDGVPTLAELIASRNQLLARNDELDNLELLLNQRGTALDDREQQVHQRAGELEEREQALAARESAVTERELANANEAQRLADVAIAQAAKAAEKPAGTKKAATAASDDTK
ncbi:MULTISPECIES: hypothetical protein [unclassified Duganella]|uniref:hypothetical protein n=1 Tax=unclassified Duganella TaxID=2636909 RepID=UPI000882CDCE|nr:MULTISPECIES: hypothetical protein [unclassified Duganella]SDF81387.1 hypothetical protein SAMN05216320_1011404 [Duganella sp. OV458]SDI48045.1 hypothetical protein SAMN05428973_10111 [Duganella sp. OV510]